jgi:hypothetical protein
VHVEQVDGVEFERVERLADATVHVSGGDAVPTRGQFVAVDDPRLEELLVDVPARVVRSAPAEGETAALRGDDDGLPVHVRPGDRLADHPLGTATAVVRGGVDRIAAPLRAVTTVFR